MNLSGFPPHRNPNDEYDDDVWDGAEDLGQFA